MIHKMRFCDYGGREDVGYRNGVDVSGGKWLCTATAPGLPESGRTERGVGGRGVDFRFDAVTDGRAIETVSIIAGQTRESLGGLSSNPPSAARTSLPNLAASPPSMATRRCLLVTTAPSSPAQRCRTGLGQESDCRSSHPASPRATATSNRSTAESGTTVRA